MTEKYGVKEYIDEYKQALEQQPERAKPQGKPNVLQMIGAKKEQGKTEWPLT